MHANHSLHKAALLMRSLDSDSAAVLLAQLTTSEAKAVRQAMRELQQIDPDEQAALRDELNHSARLRRGGVEIDNAVELELSTTLSESDIPESTQVQPAVTATAPVDGTFTPTSTEANPSPFAWLEGGDLPQLATILEREHISTVAVVLSHLPSATASQLLDALPRSRRAAALERLASLGDSDRESLEVIEKGLANWLADQKAEQRRRTDRLRSVQAILQHSRSETSRQVLADISGRDSELAQELNAQQKSMLASYGTVQSQAHRQSLPTQAVSLASSVRRENSRPDITPMPSDASAIPIRQSTSPAATITPSFPFERLTELNQVQLAELFRHCPGDRLVLALAGSSEAVTKHVQKRLPRSVAKELDRRLHQISQIRLSDVTHAQQQIAHVASRLFEPNSFECVESAT